MTRRVLIDVLFDKRVTKCESSTTLEKTLRWFSAQGVDGVTVTGNLWTKGAVDESGIVAETRYKVFPCYKCGQGRHKARLFLLGSRDVGLCRLIWADVGETRN